jgi:hypothetical protein
MKGLEEIRRKIPEFLMAYTPKPWTPLRRGEGSLVPVVGIYSLNNLSLRELLTTEMELSIMARAPNMGLSRIPKKG